MKIVIATLPNNLIATSKDLNGMKPFEAAHLVCELESLKKQVLEIWEQIKN
jgi:hypothetical protein